jgi:formate/nitrite transporter
MAPDAAPTPTPGSQTQSNNPMAAVDAYAPAQIAALVETRGVAKAKAPLVSTFVLSILAGSFIALGAVLSTVVATGSELGFGITRWLAGLAFSVGLILVVVAGAELFTGNNLIVMSWVNRHITAGQLLTNWTIVWVGNLVGALAIAGLVYLADWGALGESSVGGTALTVAAGKAALPFGTVFFRGILCNALVCLAVWLAMAGRTVVDKVFAIMFPIAAFVAAGFEHSVANMYFIPVGMLLRDDEAAVATSGLTAEQLNSLDLSGAVNNIVAATLGNIIGGAVLVGLVYWFVYLRDRG